jgi:phenylalanyl-tRNA synthetase beta chain
VRWEAVEGTIKGGAVGELQRIQPLEIYRDPKGKAIAAGSYSMLVRVVFQSNERTLTEEELTAWSTGIVDALTKLGGAQRA